ncbi:MAG: hypothetical protein ACREM9_14135 [Gemmatimonadales bacterium]
MVPRTIRLAGRLRTAACLAVLAAACGGPAPVPPPEPATPPDPCVLPTGEPGEPRELLVATVHPEDPAVVATGRREPLIRLDCTGAARPAAAESWTPDSSHRTWTFVLTPSATAITAGSVAAEWRSRPEAATTLRQAGVASVVPLDHRRLVVTLDWHADSVPALFAHPALALVTDSLPETGTSFVMRRPASGDLRDALEGGADIVRSGDPVLTQYARSLDDFTVHSLPWSRTYLLIIPTEREEFRALIPGDTGSFRAALARDAVPTDARGAEPPYWWDGLRYCPPADEFPRPGPSGVTNSVLFTQGDPVARALAERVAALSDDPATATAGLPERAMAGALRSGAARAYIAGVPRTPLLPCSEVVMWPPDATVIPLVDTRMSAIVRRGVPPLTVDFDGTLRPVEAP